MKTLHLLLTNIFDSGEIWRRELKKGFIIIFLVGITHSVFAQNYTVNGTAVNFGNGLVRMTSYVPQPPLNPGDWQTSSAWSTTKHDLSTPFDRTFNLFFGCESGPNGGDGITFTFQNQGANALGGGGGFLGLGGITPAISIEFDTYDGTPWGGSNELAADHIAIDRNGNVNNTTSSFIGASGTPTTVQPILNNRDLEDCSQNTNDYYTVRIVWDPVTKSLKLYEEGVLRLTYTEDIVNTIFGGSSMVYWGFTSATGSASNEQWIAPEGEIIPWTCSFATSCCNTFSITPSGPANYCGTAVTWGLAGTYASYDWSNGSNTSTASITSAGTYTVRVIQNQSGRMCPSSATFTVASSCPTPVEMISFYSDRVDNAALITWTTASEKNNHYFEVLHSTDGINYNSIANVKGKGNSAVVNSYSFSHQTPSAGINYYKLNQYDFNGEKTNCGTNTLTIDGVQINVFPNPSADNFNVKIFGTLSANITISDITGRELFNMTGSEFSFGEALSKGSYILKVTTDEEVKTICLVKEN